jgi:phosphoserine phosphatase
MIPLNDGVKDVITEFKKNDIYIAIATDSYKELANDLKKHLQINAVFANKLVIKDKRVTGELIIHNISKKQDFIDNKVYSICKSYVLEKLCKKLSIKPEESIAIGDGIVDRGMLKIAGLGVAYNTSNEVNKYADVSTDKMVEILNYI